MRVIPFDLTPGSNVLVIGAGGGFDFVCGLPIALELEAWGHQVHLANYSFTDLEAVRRCRVHSESLLEVDADAVGDDSYFPERDVSLWYRTKKGTRRPVWCLAKRGLVDTLDSYKYLVATLQLDTVICVDGGVDGLFRGDEADLGTPTMDTISVFAAHLCGANRRIYASVGFGTEGAEGQVSHAQALERMAELVASSAALGVSAILKTAPAGSDFLDAVDFVFSRMPPIRRSIMVSSLAAAVRGGFGRMIVHPKVADRPPWISPLTSLIWYFDADAVAKAKPYYAEALRTTTIGEFADVINATRDRLGVKPFAPIPI